MSKAVLISIKSQWCELIANGKKTIEVRKTRPNLKTPFKVYIYCTKAKKHFVHNGISDALDDLYRMPNGEIKFGYSGELMCCGKPYNKDKFLNGKVIGEFVCDDIKKGILNITEYVDSVNFGSNETCLSVDEIKAYLGVRYFEIKGQHDFYGWHISNPIIYNKPKELIDFYTKCDNGCEDCNYWKYTRANSEEFDMECSSGIYGCKPLHRPPQSWCYVEEVQ